MLKTTAANLTRSKIELIMLNNTRQLHPVQLTSAEFERTCRNNTPHVDMSYKMSAISVPAYEFKWAGKAGIWLPNNQFMMRVCGDMVSNQN